MSVLKAQARQGISHIYIYLFVSYQSVYTGSESAVSERSEYFRTHWPYCLIVGKKVPVEQTNIPAHLEQMLVILQEEEVTSERGMYGPCLEYLLQHKLLETMYTLARSDVCLPNYTWVKVFRIIPEFRILRLTFYGKSASKY